MCVGAVEMSKLYAIVAGGEREEKRNIKEEETEGTAVCECRNLGHMVEYFWTFFSFGFVLVLIYVFFPTQTYLK